MIETLLGQTQPNCFSFSSHGHARPDVCSAVTGLVSSVITFLVNLEHDTGGIIVDCLIGDGCSRLDVCILVDEPDLVTTVKTAFKILSIGLDQIAYSAELEYNQSVLQSRTVDNDYIYIKKWRTARSMTKALMKPPTPK